ncbi:MAG: flagellar basal body P-ring protein FlgI [Gammaproteobacteria bacterium]|nr:flagellar basal body P-ring protein FlgI [Gammaproteobacteria bacterium]
MACSVADRKKAICPVFLIGCFKVRKLVIFLLITNLVGAPVWAASVYATGGVRIKDLSRLSSARDNALVGYGLVTGLAGTGDSARSSATMQSIKNILQRFNVIVPLNDVRSRNAAAVMVTTTLPPYAQNGDKLDINVTSLGDSRSLVGGTLLLTHLTGADQRVYALAQGQLLVGGFSYDLNGNVMQKNHPTSAYIAGGALVERSLRARLMSDTGYVQYNLHNPDFSTANLIADSLDDWIGAGSALAVDAARVRIKVPESARANLVRFLTHIENTIVEPDIPSRVVVNERTGTVVSGGNVRISAITVTHGDLNVAISTEYTVSQPLFVRHTGDNVRTVVVPETSVEVEEDAPINVSLPNNSTIADLISALNRVKASSRDIITILQGIKRAGALHAELIIQ